MNSPSDTVAIVVLWACTALVAYTYIGYPIVIGLLAHLSRRGKSPPVVVEEDLPRVSLLIAAYNEEDAIGETIRGALALDYPADRLEIVVGSDGSTDTTPSTVRAFASASVRLLDYSERRGKAAVLNDAVPRTHGEVVLFSDANTRIDFDALRRLACWFADPSVGVVVGRLVLTDPATGRNADGLYWKYETYLKRCEGKLGALLGANGAIYAMRKACYQPLPEGTILDDFVEPLLARLQSGCRIVYEPDAVAAEESAPDLRTEFQRRARIGAGGFQSLQILAPLLDPRQGIVAFTFFSHKVLRWLCPFFLLGVLTANLALCLSGQGSYVVMMLAQLTFYGASMTAGFLPPGLARWKLLRLSTMFTGMNAALLVGFCRWASGTQRAAWRRTPRGGEVGAVRQ